MKPLRVEFDLPPARDWGQLSFEESYFGKDNHIENELVLVSLNKTKDSFHHEDERVTRQGIGVGMAVKTPGYIDIHNREADERGYTFESSAGDAFAIGAAFAILTLSLNHAWLEFKPQTPQKGLGRVFQNQKAKRGTAEGLPPVTEDAYSAYKQEKSQMDDIAYWQEFKKSQPYLADAAMRLGRYVNTMRRDIKPDTVQEGAVFAYRLSQRSIAEAASRRSR